MTRHDLRLGLMFFVPGLTVGLTFSIIQVGFTTPVVVIGCLWVAAVISFGLTFTRILDKDETQ